MPLALILILGFLLRVYQLGADNFWIDEIGVARAARMASAGEALAEAHTHVMAMPLDYLAAWLFARVGTSEFWLRLPAVMWGTAALLAAFALFRRLSNRNTALVAALLLAISPIHVQYSQELRFYSALVFFYLLSSALLLRAIQTPGAPAWIAFSLATALGILFHVFVLLTALTGAAWLWITFGRDQTYLDARRYFLRSAAFLLIIFLAAVVLFGGVNTAVEIPLFFQETVFSVFAVGLGWMPFYSTFSVWPWIFGALCFTLAVIGMVAAVRTEPRGLKSALLYSLVVQILLVVLMNALKNYFLAPRQFLFALPAILFFTAEGIGSLVSGIARLRGSRQGQVERLIWISLLLALVITVVPALHNYYAGEKGCIREITASVMDAWHPGDVLLIIPDYEAAAYAYYRDQVNADHPIYERVVPADWSSLSQEANDYSRGFLITPYPLDSEQAVLIDMLNFEPFYLPDAVSRYSQAVWIWKTLE